MINHYTFGFQSCLKVLKIEFRELCISLSRSQIKSVFERAGFTNLDLEIESNNRRELIETYYNLLDWDKSESMQILFKAIEQSLQHPYLEESSKNYMKKLCKEVGFSLDENDIFTMSKDLFSQQFPNGLPFGLNKPNVSISAHQGSQAIQYETKNNNCVLKKGIYPDFTFKKLEALYGLSSDTNLRFKHDLINMNQTEYEKDFFLRYAQKFDISNKEVPVLIPQAWIQWHSQTKKNLRSESSSYVDELYRADFVAFWNWKRYVILVDDISHYAIKKDSSWWADQENYSKRLKEDRKLRNENWLVFRVSNWELRDNNKTDGILEDLRQFIVF